MLESKRSGSLRLGRWDSRSFVIGENQFCCYKCAGISFTVEFLMLSPDWKPAIGSEDKVMQVLTCLNPRCGSKIRVTTAFVEVDGTLHSESD